MTNEQIFSLAITAALLILVYGAPVFEHFIK